MIPPGQLSKSLSQVLKIRNSSAVVLRLDHGLSLVVVCLAVILLSGNNFACAKEQTDPEKAATASKKNEEVEQLATKANQLLAAYKANANPVQWDAFWRVFVRLIEEAVTNSCELSAVFKPIAQLSEFGFRMTDSPPLKVFSFTRVPESQQILVEWKEPVLVKVPLVKAVGKRAVAVGKKVGKKAVGKKAQTSSPVKTVLKYGASHFQVLPCPGTVYVNDARLILGTSGESSSPTASTSHATHLQAGKYLVLCGADKKTGLAWLGGFRLANGAWIKCPELFSGVPPYLLENVQGKASFSGSNLVFSSEPLKSSGADASGYKLVLRFLGDHFALDTKSSLEEAMAVATQFSQAIQKGRVDLVKAWLVDAKLASIPGYLGLYNRPAGAPPFKLIGMAAPLNGGSRYRLITYDKNDLILDIGKIKAQWAVKGIFIAPADPVAKRLMGLSQPDNKVLDAVQEQKKGKLEGDGN